MPKAPFSPYQSLAEILLTQAGQSQSDGSHDLSHLYRVWSNACSIHRDEGGDLEVLLAATLLHDCVSVEKNSPLRSQASRLAAEKAASLLKALDWPQDRIDAVAHAVEAHSFSAAITPTTLEAKIVQDADRLDAIGMLGVARCFYTAGRMGSAMYDATDANAQHRELDDKRFAVDHFHTKLLHVADGFQTATGARIAALRHERLKRFLDEFMEEVGAD
ncbi:HD domain-containing protein [Pseudomonas sp. CCI4.2]|uniref:HD domain-containing protein n=1 Tax=Pseudomonas sp. CCI4.2 TaxID=3048620 RepID=UPI002AC93454|nr:HD domain-containing protein [Pseudomonas sp. CCI4.2]MEB0090772.1 HD domain-containing protein [Pseudomonas sp. CCI4.2]WPX52614.1 HD domain-containing protein [Pseudomonas sp. CCI4.2]